MAAVSGESLPVGPDCSIQGRLNGLLFPLASNLLGAEVLEVVLRERRLRWRQRVVVRSQPALGWAARQCLVILMYGEPVAEVGITEAPASDSVVPRLIATSDVVVSQLFHGFERVEATTVDRYQHQQGST